MSLLDELLGIKDTPFKVLVFIDQEGVPLTAVLPVNLIVSLTQPEVSLPIKACVGASPFIILTSSEPEHVPSVTVHLNKTVSEIILVMVELLREGAVISASPFIRLQVPFSPVSKLFPANVTEVRVFVHIPWSGPAFTEEGETFTIKVSVVIHTEFGPAF